MSRWNGLGILALVCGVGMLIGAGTYVFGGIVTYVGLHIMVSTIPLLRWMVYHFGKLIDVCLFVFTFYMALTTGVTIGVSLIITSLGFTILLRPWIRDTYHIK